MPYIRYNHCFLGLQLASSIFYIWKIYQKTTSLNIYVIWEFYQDFYVSSYNTFSENFCSKNDYNHSPFTAILK